MSFTIETGLPEGEMVDTADALSDAFADYPVPIRFTVDTLGAMIAADDVVRGLCRRARDPTGQIVGVALGAVRGHRGRVAAMGVTRAAHRTGVGRALGASLLDALADAGVTEVILEALTVNGAALSLYEGPLGFTRRRRLVGFERSPGGTPIDDASWDRALHAGGEPDSWQLARVVVAARAQHDLVSVPAVVPERHAVAVMLADAGFAHTRIDQYELSRRLG